MNRTSRIKLLEKLAAKSDKLEKFRGKKNRKELQKHLEKIKKEYIETSSSLKDAISQLEKLQQFIDNNKEKEQLTRSEMKKVHTILTNMDFAGSEEVRIGSDEDDVAYVVDGKPYSYCSDTHSLSKYESKRKSKSDVSDSDDFIYDEGTDVNIGGS
jgi:seryl-tRNA synthetase